MMPGMLFTADFGNTLVHWTVFDGKRAVRQGSVPAASVNARRLAAALGTLRFRVRAAAYVTVVPARERSFRAALRRLFGTAPHRIDHRSPLGMRVAYRPPRAAGADRLAAAAAAVGRFGAPVIVVDFGTAVTVDAVSRRREFLGGAIAPGSSLMADALARGTAKLPRVVPARPRAAIGRGTRECIRSGTVAGCAALVDGLVERMRREVGRSAPVVATGGGAALVAPLTRHARKVVPGLVLDGVRRVAVLHGSREES